MIKLAFKYLIKTGFNVLSDAIFGKNEFEFGFTEADVYEQHRSVPALVVAYKPVDESVRWN